MRLGIYPALLKKNTIAYETYKKAGWGESGQDALHISERHRHRYEVHPDYIEKFEEEGLIFSGLSPDERLMEVAELSKSKHPFFLGTQFHPERSGAAGARILANFLRVQ
jgi:CTP synthase